MERRCAIRGGGWLVILMLMLMRWMGCEEEDAVLYSAAPPARAIRPYGAGPSSLLIIDWEKNPAHPCPLASQEEPWATKSQHHLPILIPSR